MDTPEKSEIAADEVSQEVETSELEQPEKADNAGSAQTANTALGSREITVSALVHLLGLASADQFRVMESKIDGLTTKLSSISMKMDRFATELKADRNETLLERVDFQLTDLRAVMKKVLPMGMARFDGERESGTAEAEAPKILKSSPKPEKTEPAPQKSTPPPVVDENSEESATPDDLDFQQAEADRIREEMEKQAEERENSESEAV